MATEQPQADPRTEESQGETPDEKFDRERREAQLAQNIEPGSNTVPEQRPIAATSTDAPQGIVRQKMEAADDPRVNDEPMGREAYERAESDAQMKKAAKASRVPRLYPGAHIRIKHDDADHPDHGRTAAVLRVNSYVDTQNAILAASGVPEAQFAEVEEYEVRTRDGRHELLMVKPENIEVLGANDYYKSPT